MVLNSEDTAANETKDLLEKHAILQSPSRIEELVKIFIHATNVSGPLAHITGTILINWSRWRPASGTWEVGSHRAKEELVKTGPIVMTENLEGENE